MKSGLSLSIVKEFADTLNLDYNYNDLRDKVFTSPQNKELSIQELNHLLNEVGSFIGLTFVEQQLRPEAFEDMFIDPSLPILVYIRNAGLKPFIIKNSGGDRVKGKVFEKDEIDTLEISITQLIEIIHTTAIEATAGKSLTYILFLAPLVVRPTTSNYDPGEHPTPVQRLWRLLVSESKDISYIYIYAITAGILSLTTPLGVQAIIGLVSGGLILEPVIVLIGFVIIATFLSGALQVMQVRIVETLKQRIFAKAAFEFAYRVPRISLESVSSSYAPELMNRFFDILTVQKGISKILTDFLAAVLQILFGLLLLSFYHPFFIFFGFILLLVLFIIFRYTGKRGLSTSILESKYKYKIVHWLEEVARTLATFKLAGFTNLPVYKMDEHLSNYLKKRQAHFKVLVNQYISIVIFKTLITGGILILGSFLVIDNQITLGQFVASDIVIITILAAVEKIILNLDVIYDILTALDKVGYVTDIPIVKSGGVILSSESNKGYEIQTANLHYKYPGAKESTLKGIDIHIQSGEKIGVIGKSGAGKTTFVNVVTGLYESYEGMIMYEGYSLQDINISSLRDNIGDNLSGADIFDGTILENITVGKSNVSIEDVRWALEKLGIYEYVLSLPKGLHTHLVASGHELASGMAKKIILARTLAERPKLIVFDDFLSNLELSFQEYLIDYLFSHENTATVLAVSPNPYLLQKCDRIVIVENGKILTIGTYEQLVSNPIFRSLVQYETKNIHS